ncbi:MAG: S8/S53 family peptidase, partial [Chloroflexales bacterium]|nr:S8/S53 family peptidase [Chloroflexales bacterium]
IGDVPDAHTNPRRLLELVREINRQVALSRRAVRERDDALRTRLQIASPNWLMSGTPSNAGGGGPGARPIPFVPPQDASTQGGRAPGSAEPELAKFTLPGLSSQSAPADQSRVSEEPKSVEVVILDTAPTREDFARAWETWGSAHARLNGLIGTGGKLLDENGNRRVHYAPYSNLLGVTDVDLEKHPYVMSDHGLFVAGIVNAIAPEANLHMAEVLNPYGVGTLHSIADGFKQALEIAAQRPGSRVLVNASLVLNMPQSEAVLNDAKAYLADVQSMTADDIKEMKGLLKLLVDLLQQSNVLVVAAAGNDSTPELPHPGARFPAAFNNVVGVSALRDETQPASYSNLADEPVDLGIATFGGASDGDSADGARGLIGLYIGTFPNGVPNSTGWARWAGTSFATPIITGVLAQLATQGGPAASDPLKPLRDAYTAHTNTGVGEVFPVTQG